MPWDIWYAFKNFGRAIGIFCQEISRPLRENFSFRHVLCVQGMLKLAFLYSACIFWIIMFDFQLPKKFDKSTPTISVYSTERIGEKLLAQRMKIAAEANGWQVIYVCFQESMVDFFLTSHFYTVAASVLNMLYEPKFNIAVTHYVHVVPYGYNAVYLNLPNEMLFNIKGHFKSQYSHLGKYDAYVDIYSVANGSNSILLKELKRVGKSHAPVIPLYLAHHYVEYSPAKREQVLTIGSLWGCVRGSLDVKLALKKLSDEKMLVAYGIEDQLDFLGDSYKGTIEDYVEENNKLNNSDGLQSIMKEYGISLVIHNLGHVVDKIPTSRITESIAAGSIVISDQNEFVQKFFGDTVLYINTIAQSDYIYSQLKQHIEWIKSHPEEVENKARAAYDIFAREFTLEKSLQTVMDEVEADRGYN